MLLKFYPRFAEAARYWESKRKNDKLPARSDIDPIEIPHLLPAIALIDVETTRGRNNFRFRLMGTQLVEIVGHDLTGSRINEDTYGPNTEGALAVLTKVTEAAMPLIGQGQSILPLIKPWPRLAWICLPLAEADASVNMILAVIETIATEAVKEQPPVEINRLDWQQLAS